ncbi:hypothetical protein ACFUN8_08075 [Streptomyces sp. NPDC057307]|uniref:hypothetical protein n=1 Tax=Streptomyces sp. NPDC057307 TaxID=3346096 RepID=UPI00362576B7
MPTSRPRPQPRHRPRLRSAVDRTLLAVLGAVLAGAGVWVLTGHQTVRAHLPGWWPASATARTDGALTDRALLSRLRDDAWWTPAVIAALAVVFLLLVWWLLAQFRTGQPRTLPLPRPGLGLRTGALTAAMEERTERIPGVDRARVTLSGRPHRLRATFSVRLEADAVPADVVRRIVAGPVTDARTSSEGARRIDAVVRLRAPAGTPGRSRPGLGRTRTTRDTTRAPLL